MKQRNFILEFAFKTKYNFFACIMALLVLIFSVSSITYAWIEGATSLTLNGAAKVYTDADAAVKLSADSATNNTLPLSSYIDPSLVCLAPASGSMDQNGNINVIFGTRPENTNDISNNYLFFEVKVKCADLVTGLAFSGSSIKINDANAENIKTGVTLLNAADRSVVTSGIYSAAQIASGVTAVDGMTEGGEYILQFKIWNEGTANAGSQVAVNLTLVTQRAATTIYLNDYTNTASADSALNGKTVRIKSGEDVINITPSKSADNITYEFKNVPDKYLSSLTFEALNTDNSVYASWRGIPLSKETTSYTVYGDPTKSYGTTGSVSLVTLSDASYENLLKLDGSDVTIDNSVLNGGVNESYAMRKVSDKKYSAYVPNGSVGKTVTFANGKHSVLGTYSTTNKNYYIFGEKESSETIKPCIGFFSSSETILTNNVQTITIRDMTTASLNSNGYSVYASYPGFGSTNGDLYKAYYDTTANSWKINAYYADDFSIDGKVWSFKATDGTDVHTWNDSNTNNKPSGKSTYYFTTANGASSAGTWEYNESGIDRDILTGAKVSFYAGIDSSWNNSNLSAIYLNKNDNNTVVRADQFIKTDTNLFIPIIKDSTTYATAAFTLPPLEYYISDKESTGANSGWDGKPFGETANGGKFYGVMSTGENQQAIVPISPITGATTINSKNGVTESSPVSVEQGSTNVNFATATNGNKSVANYDLYVEYYICPKASVADKNAYECLNPFVPTAEPKGTQVTDNSASETLDLSAYPQGNYVIKTVLTDGKVYYVANDDYLTITAPRAKRNVQLEAVQGGSGAAKVTYEGGEISSTSTTDASASIAEGEVLTITVTPDTSTKNYVFEKIEIYEGETLKDTLETNGSTFTIPTSSNEEHPDIIIKPYVKEQQKITLYFKKPSDWGTTTKAYAWTKVGDNTTNNAAFPGEDMTLVDGETDIYYIVLDAGKYKEIIFTDKVNSSSSTHQTKDLTIPGDLTTENMYDENATSSEDPDGDKWVLYTPKVYYTVKVTAPSGVSITATPDGGSATNVGAGTTEQFTIENGKKITLNATPTDSSGYYNVTWTGGTGKSETNHSGSLTSTYAPTITADTDITVAFTNHTYKLTYPSGVTAVNAATSEAITDTTSYLPENTVVHLTYTNADNHYKLTWAGGDDGSSTEVLPAGTTSAVYKATMTSDRTVTLTTDKLFKVTYPNEAQFTSLSEAPVESNTTANPRYAYFKADTTNIKFTAVKPDESKSYSYTWSDGSGGTGSAETFTIASLTKDVTLTLDIKEVTNRTIKLSNDAHARVTATYGGTAWDISSSTEKELAPGTVIKLTVNTADGIVTGDNAALNGYKFSSVKVKVGSGTEQSLSAGTPSTTDRIVTNTFEYIVPSDGATDAITITTSTELEKFVLCGENIGYGGSNWNSYYTMTGEGDPATAVTYTFTAEGTTAKFKIVELGSDSDTSKRRDEPQYSVTINSPTLEVNGETKNLSGDGDNTHVYLDGLTSGKEVTVKYDLAANKIIVTYEVPVSTPVWYLAGTFNGYNINSHDTIVGYTNAANKFTETSDGLYELTFAFDSNNQYLQVYDATNKKFYGPSDYQDGLSENTTSYVGQAVDASGSTEKWRISVSNATVKIIWDPTAKTIKWTSNTSSGGTSRTLTVNITQGVLTADNETSVQYTAKFTADGKTESIVSMDSQGSGKYTCTIPDGYTTLVIQRRHGSIYDQIWNYTSELTLPSGDYTYTISAFSGSSLIGSGS